MDAAPTSPASSIAARRVLPARLWWSAAILVVAAMLQAVTWPSPDVAWLTSAAGRMLDGQRLYTDILETNPPMAVLLYLPWVAAAKLVGLAAWPAVIAATLALATASTALTAHMLDRAPFAWWPVTLALLTVFPGGDFAQREHFALIFILPILAAVTRRAAGEAPSRAAAIVAGVLGGLAMAIKPHFALALALPSLYAAFRTRRIGTLFSLENWIAGLTLIAFWGLIALALPAYLTDILPRLALAYVPDGLDVITLARLAPLWMFWALAVLLPIYRREVVATPLGVPWLLAALGFLLTYFIQAKGFGNHALPAVALLLQIFALVFLARNAADQPWRKALVPGLLVAILLLAPVFANLRPHAERDALAAAVRPLGRNLSFINLTPKLEVANPLALMTGDRFVGSDPFLWMALGAINGEHHTTDPDRLAKLRAIEALELATLRADLGKQPDFVLVGGDDFDWLGWARGDPQIAKQLGDYSVYAAVPYGPFTVTVLARTGLAAQPAAV